MQPEVSRQLDSEIRQAKDAARIFGDPFFVKVMDSMESDLITQMRQVPMADHETQHELILSLQLLGNLKRRFQVVIDTGRLAETQKQSLADRAKRAFGRK